jgi:NADPH:quinone reductase-like Zn-dependent oxidoreductase
MKAIVINSYGSSEVLEKSTIDIPKVGRRQLLVEVHAAGVNPLDWKIRKGMMKLLTGKKFPKIIGSDIAGIVKEIGGDVKRFKIGDEVFAMINAIFNQGGYAEYAVIDEKNACKKPENLSFMEAGCVPCAASTALQVFRDKVKLKRGQKILINGASGGVGTFAIQIAKIFGAIVTGVCSGKNTELVASLGADDVIDYTKSDFIKGDVKYDVIFDAVGNKEFFACKYVLSPGGIYITLVPNGKRILLSLITSVLPGKKCKFISVKPNLQDLSWLKEKIEEETIKVVIDKTYPLENAREAHEYMETGHARGKVVLILNGRSN